MSMGQLKSHIETHFTKEPIRHKKGERNPEQEKKVLEWILHVVGDKEAPKTDFGKYIQDGCVLSDVMTNIVFNSVSREDISTNWGSAPQVERVNALIREMHRYGVQDVFSADDLLAMRDIGRVTRNLMELAELASKDKGSIAPRVNA